MAKHTPGPWIATGWKATVVNDAAGNTLAIAPAGHLGVETATATARLIAAAPELLDACRAVQRYFDDHLLGDPQGEHEHRQLRMLVQDAIAKATS